MNLKERLFKVVATFEGGQGFQNLSWNFDGQGASMGFIQFPFGQGKAQVLIKAMARKNPTKFRQLCTTRVTYKQGTKTVDQVQDLSGALLAACDLPAAEGTKWIVERQYKTTVRGKTVWKPLDHWERIFKALLADAEFQEVQIELAAPYWKDAVDDFRFYAGETVGQLLFCLDVAVQNGAGKIGRTGQKICIAEFLRLGGSMKQNAATRFNTLAKAVASTCREEYQKDVAFRKGACLNGKGVVHGDKVADLFARLGIDANAKVTAEDLAA